MTTDDLPGYEIREVLGEVVGTTARSHNPFNEGVKSLRGGADPRASEHLTHWREDAVERMVDAARLRGANAVIGMRFDHRRVSEYWNEICAYGTAVIAARRVEPTGTLDPHAGQRMGAGT